jgi:hypothetical protein
VQSIYNPDDKRQVQQVVNELVRQFDNTGSITLALSKTSTVVSNPKIRPDSVIVLQPRNTSAASIAATTFVSSKADGQFTITHPSSTTPRAFDYVIHGV